MSEELDPRREQAEAVARTVLRVVNTYKRAIGVAETPVPDEGSASERLNGVIDGVFHAWDNPTETPEQNHQQWIDSMTSRGWILGALDETNKTHPALVPYAELPPAYLLNDALFINVVQANKPTELPVAPAFVPVVSPDMSIVPTHTDDPKQADQIAAVADAPVAELAPVVEVATFVEATTPDATVSLSGGALPDQPASEVTVSAPVLNTDGTPVQA